MTSLLRRTITCSDANCAASGLARQMAKAPFWRVTAIGCQTGNVMKEERGGLARCAPCDETVKHGARTPVRHPGAGKICPPQLLFMMAFRFRSCDCWRAAVKAPYGFLLTLQDARGREGEFRDYGHAPPGRAMPCTAIAASRPPKVRAGTRRVRVFPNKRSESD